MACKKFFHGCLFSKSVFARTRVRVFILFTFILLSFFSLTQASYATTCVVSGTYPTAFSKMTTAITGTLGLMTTTVTNRLIQMQTSVTGAIKANSESQTSSIQWLAQQIGEFTDAELKETKRLLKKSHELDTNQALAPSVGDCEAITLQPGAEEASELVDAARDALEQTARNDFTNDENSPYSLNVATATHLQFMEYMAYYCDPKANNGNMPDSNNQLEFVCSVDDNNDGKCDLFGGTLAVNTPIKYHCGSGRETITNLSEAKLNDDRMDGYEARELINADVNVSDIMFGSTTWPRNETTGCASNPDKKECYGARIHAASGQMSRLLNVSPQNAFNTSVFDTNTGIAAFMERRTFQARALLANSQFSYINSKRLPTISRGAWVRANMKKEMSGFLNNNSIGVDLNSSEQQWENACSNVTTDKDKTVCAMYMRIADIPDVVSHAQYMDFMMMDRYLGTNFYLEAMGMPNEVRRNQIRLLAHSLVQQREINNTLERILGVMAANYALKVDATSNINPTEIGQ